MAMQTVERQARHLGNPLAKVSCPSILCFPGFNIHNGIKSLAGSSLGGVWP